MNPPVSLRWSIALFENSDVPIDHYPERYQRYNCSLALFAPLYVGANGRSPPIGLEFKTEAFQAIIDESAKVDARAKKIKPQDLVDRRYLDGLQKGGFFDKLWATTK